MYRSAMKLSLGCLVFSLCFLFGSADDSVVEGSRTPGSTVVNSMVRDSNLTDSEVRVSQIVGTTADKSAVLYSIVDGSKLNGALLNATYDEPGLSDQSPKITFSSSSDYRLNRISDSDITKSTIGYHQNCIGTHYNATVVKSIVNLSGISGSIITGSKLNDNSLACFSVVTSSDIKNGTRILNSDVVRTDTTSSDIFNSRTDQGKSINSRVFDSEIVRSNVFDSEVKNSHLNEANTDHSELSNSEVKRSETTASQCFNSQVKDNSKVQNSQLMNSNVKGGIVISTKLTNSNIVNSQLQNCVIINSHIKNRNLNGVTMMNNMLFSFK